MMYAYSDMECDRHNCHFRPFFALLPHYSCQKLKFWKNVKKSLDILSFYTCVPYNVWRMVPEIWSVTEFFCHLQSFFTLLPPWKMKISKTKKKPGDIIILQKCTKNPDHRLYCSRDMTCDDWNCFFNFGLYFSLLRPPNSPKNQNFIKMKKNLEISSFYTSVPKIMIICFTVPEKWNMTNVIVIFHFGLFYALLPFLPF